MDALTPDTIDLSTFHLLADNAPTLCWIANGDGYMVWYNRRWHDYCGTTPEQMEGWGWTAVHDPEILPAVLERWTGCIAAGEPFEMTFPLRGADGGFRPFLTRVQPVRSTDGRVARWFGVNTDISKQVEIDEALRRERDRSRDVLENMGDAFVLLDHDFRIVEINAQAMRLERRPREAILGRTHWEAWPGSDTTEVGRLYRQAMAERRPVSLEHSFVWPDGRRAWIEMRAYPSRAGLAVFYRDVSERKTADEKLRLLNADLERQVTERARERGRTWQVTPDMLGVLNAQGFFESSNPAWRTILGWSEAEIAGAVFLDFVHPEDLAATSAVWTAAQAGRPALRFENRYRTKTGDYRWLSWVAVPEGGKVYCTARDVTEEKAQAQALAERTAERDRWWRNSQDMLVIIDTQGTFRAVSPAVTRTLGWTAEEMIGRTVFDFIVPEDVASTGGALAHASQDALPTYENRYRHKDGGAVWISWVAAPEGDLIYATGRNVTREKAAAAELERVQEQLRQAQKMEAVGQLTGGIAHDFNNMLAVVIGSLDLLGRRLGQEDARARRYIDAALEGARRAALLTQRLLAFSRQQPLRPEPIDANKLVAGMSDLLRHSLGVAVQLETVLSGGLWRTQADPNQLENVLLNLAVNARDAMPDGGRLTIETQNAHLDARYVAAEIGVPAGHYVLIAVSDTGAGMPAEVAAKAFDPFFTTKAVGKGTGLGLSQVYGFVRQSGGHVKIYSEAGQGTTVKVYLPRLTGAADDDAQPPDSPAPAMGDAREVVLVVEDEPAVRRFSVEALEELGYRVLEADGAAAALRLIDAHPEIALLFTDIVMPDVNGRKLADAARARRPDLKVLFTTGYTRNAVVHNGVVDAGVELIGKPFTIEALAAVVRQVLDASVPAGTV